MPRQRQDRGFALLITIVLLAFLVLLLVTLAGTTRVETQLTNNSLQLTQARSNALMALNVAIGQLQLYAGPDQRVTTNANFGAGATSGASGVVTPVQGSKQWVGVWGNSQPANNIYAANPSPVFLNWLVSGNEPTASSSTIPTVSTDGHITSSATTPAYLPSTVVSGLTGNSTATSTGITIGNSPAVLLVGNATAGNLTTFTAPLDRYVVAPLVAISSSSVPGVTGNATVGHYAWWVGDEGVKAQYNLLDKFASSPGLGTGQLSGNATAALYQLSTPGRDAFEILTGLTSYPVNDPSLDSIITPNQFLIAPQPSGAPANIVKYLPSMSDLVTAGSYGLLTNSQSGGLRTDLTQLFNESTLSAAYKGQPIIGSLVTGNATTATLINGSSLSPAVPNFITPGSSTNGTNLSPVAGATWDTLKAYYTFSQSMGGAGATVSPVQVQVASATSPAISPVIVQNRLMINLRTTLTNGGTYPSTTEYYVQAQPIFVIGNPYPFPITASNGVAFSYGITTSLPDSSEWGLSIGPHHSQGNYVYPAWESSRFSSSGQYAYQGGSGTIPYYPILANTKQLSTAPSVLNGVQFVTQPFTLQPGQTQVFTMGSVKSVSASSPTTVTLNPGINTTSVVGSTVPDSPTSGDITPNYYEVDIGSASAWISAGQNVANLVQVLSAEGMTLQMSLPGNSAADGTQSQPQTGVLQEIVNADLSAQNGVRITPSSAQLYRLPPFPGSIDPLNTGNDNMNGSSANPAGTPRNYIDQGGANNPPLSDTANDVGGGLPISGYATWLSLPLSDASLYSADAATLSLTGAFRTYADYNLTARNFLMPPVAPLPSTLAYSGTTPNTAISNTFETVPPYARKYMRGPASNNASGVITLTSPSITSGVNNSLVWGSTTGSGGVGNVTLYDSPHTALDGQPAIFSIAQLQHVDLTGDDDFASVSYQPRYAVGNSFASPFVSTADSIQSFARQAPARVGTTDIAGATDSAAGTNPVRMFDLSYLLNTALWDGYFFSTLQQSGEQKGQPANQRLVFNAGITPTLAQLGINGNGAGNATVADPVISGSTMPAEKAAARYLMAKGSFNINSTSVQAWEAVLAGSNGMPFNGNSGTGTPFARSLNQGTTPSGATESSSNYNAAVTTASLYDGYRRLTTAQITTLATNIVAQVRARGPFLSLAQFVNRALGANTDPRTVEGALQAAIDASSINAFTNSDTNNQTAKTYPTPQQNNNPSGSSTSSATAIPGWLTQADVLQSIGSILSARSDTFTVRAYGEVVNPVTQQVTGRAWCEAVVQRFPDYTDPTVSPAADPNAQATTRNFGRKFRIVSFRWLDPNDISTPPPAT